MTQNEPLFYDRSWRLEDIEILSRAKGGDGRTVTAYAAVFDLPTEVHDQFGDYVETIDRTSFNRTLANNGANRAMVLYNHGLTVYGTADALSSVPIGKPVEVRADSRGLLTVSRYNKSQLADAVLESIGNGDITSQSFRGRIFKSDPMRVPKVKPGQPLPNVRRMELGLTDYGPTPQPVYKEAAITAVRSASELAQDFARLDETGRQELIHMLSATPGWDPATAAVLATPHQGPGPDDPRDTHSIRARMLALNAELALIGVQNNGT